MAQIRTGYEPYFKEISGGNPVLGRACLLPWDTEIFGFPVGCYQIGTEELDEPMKHEFSAHFLSWSRRNQLALCLCAIPAASLFWKLCLPEVGFCFVDFGVRATLNGLQTASLPEGRTQLRKAQPEDWEIIETIAAQSFRHGRYHADPLFPRQLADLRYQRWIRSALSGEHDIDHVYVMGEPGRVKGFYHVTIEGSRSDLRLAAVPPELQGTMLGFDLYVSMLHLLKRLGVRRATTSISASNTAVMNIYSMLGFGFSEPETIYHWHAANFRGWAAQ